MSDTELIHANSLFRHYFQTPPVPLDVSLSQAWSDSAFQYTQFADSVGQLVRKYASVQATSIECERVFSASGLTCSKKREQLKPSTLNNLLIVDRNVETTVLSAEDLKVMYKTENPTVHMASMDEQKSCELPVFADLVPAEDAAPDFDDCD
eukprot:ANDGO_06640.mRNA.1 hypothetical protein